MASGGGRSPKEVRTFGARCVDRAYIQRDRYDRIPPVIEELCEEDLLAVARVLLRICTTRRSTTRALTDAETRGIAYLGFGTASMYSLEELGTYRAHATTTRRTRLGAKRLKIVGALLSERRRRASLPSCGPTGR